MEMEMGMEMEMEMSHCCIDYNEYETSSGHRQDSIECEHCRR